MTKFFKLLNVNLSAIVLSGCEYSFDCIVNDRPVSRNSKHRRFVGHRQFLSHLKAVLARGGPPSNSRYRERISPTRSVKVKNHY